MAIKPAPKKEIEQFINKGGKVAKESDKDGWTVISVRLPYHLIESIDEKRAEQIGLSRNAWILAAMQEKIKK